jgi:cytochrome c oxidase subunit 2
MFFMMIYWHGAGEQNLSNEAYKIKPEKFAERSQAMIDQYTVREENFFPVVHPPAGSDVYLIARLWQWWPILELEKDQTYIARLDARLFAAARQHQCAGPPGLRHGCHYQARQGRRIRHRL